MSCNAAITVEERVPGKPVAHNYGLLYGMVANSFGLLGFPGGHRIVI